MTSFDLNYENDNNNSETQNSISESPQIALEKEEKPNIFLAIVFSLLSIFCFFVAETIIIFLIALILLILSKIPVINVVVNLITNWLSRIYDSFVDRLTVVTAVTLSVQVINWLIEKFTSNGKTQDLIRVISGVGIMLLNVAFLIINIINGDSILGNILSIICCYSLAKDN